MAVSELSGGVGGEFGVVRDREKILRQRILRFMPRKNDKAYDVAFVAKRIMPLLGVGF
jgi:hypothetical protein